MSASTFMFLFSWKYSGQLTDKREIIQSMFLQHIGFIVAKFLLMSSNTCSRIVIGKCLFSALQYIQSTFIWDGLD